MIGLNNYASSTQTIQAESSWKTVLKSYATIAATNGIIMLAIVLLAFNFIVPFILTTIQDPMTAQIISSVVTLALIAPFLWALMAKRPANIAYKELWIYKKYSRGPLLVLEVC